MPEPVTAGIVGSMLLGKAIEYAGGSVPAVASAIPGRMERNYRKDILTDRERFQGGRGGTSAGTRERGRAEGRGFQASQEQEALAQVARGSSVGAGASGVRTQMAGDIRRAGMAAGNQLDSAVRQQDLDVAQQERQGLQARMLQAYAMGQKRKDAAIAGLQAGEDASPLGMLARDADAMQTKDLTKLGTSVKI